MPERDQLAGMPAYLMMQLEARLQLRVWETMSARPPAHAFTTGLRCRNWHEAGELARWCLGRMMDKRIAEGRQFDSILESSRRAFSAMLLARAAQ